MTSMRLSLSGGYVPSNRHLALIICFQIHQKCAPNYTKNLFQNSKIFQLPHLPEPPPPCTSVHGGWCQPGVGAIVSPPPLLKSICGPSLYIVELQRGSVSLSNHMHENSDSCYSVSSSATLTCGLILLHTFTTYF